MPKNPNTKFLALEVIKMDVPVTPAEMDQCTGRKDSSSCITYFKSLGYDFTTQYDGRRVVSYTLIKEPNNVEYFRGLLAKLKGTTVAPEPVEEKKPVAKKAAPKKKAPVVKAPQKVAAKKKVKKEPVVELELDLPDVEDTSFVLDDEFDSFEGLCLKALV